MEKQKQPIITEDEFESEEEGGLELKLSNFSGALDLLLHLVKEDKIEIKDIFVSEVTAQFLSYMSQLDSVDVNKASEYMEMSATLLEIKSRALLPVMPGLDDDAETPEQILIRQLEEYKMFKEASGKLKEQEEVDRLFKQPSIELEEVNYAVKDMSLNSLLDAFANILNKVELNRLAAANPKQIKKDSFTVTDKIKYITDRLNLSKTVKFSELFDESRETAEVVVTFIALLELLKLQMVLVSQSTSFGEITITRNDKFESDEGLFNYAEETN